MAEGGHGDDLRWLSDYVVSMLKSPTWVTPIAQFVDERCGLFEDGEENALECTRCHNEFRQLVNDLFAAHLLEVSVTPEHFDRFCATGLANSQGLHRTLVEQLLSVDDFLSFKAMMTKQNADMCREVIMCGSMDSDDEPPSPTHLIADMVVRKSISEGMFDGADWKLYEDLVFRFGGGGEGGEGEQDAQQRCEEAELEKAIALSLQLEEERLRHIEANEDVLAEVREEALAASSAQAAAPAAPQQPLPPSVGFTSSPLVPLLPQKREQVAAALSVPRMVPTEPMSPVKPKKWGFVSAPLQYYAPPPAAGPDPAVDASPPPAAEAAAP
eukprot:CAMPEP_0179276414 /NCGR_PEP_ID=MMETSP0797-20121207/34567_1 /TAXON_ID=47934 /ORGANISM="Dinophysis acuminata, Strain DAEP01" /LENGTH=326 /DNA_ID=CAMNT_0020984973 /DNA_START=53 /DNA_END=1029 /DNA_ORIENTATION=+